MFHVMISMSVGKKMSVMKRLHVPICSVVISVRASRVTLVMGFLVPMSMNVIIRQKVSATLMHYASILTEVLNAHVKQVILVLVILVLVILVLGITAKI